MNFKYIILGLGASAMLSMSSCKDFLDENPRTDVGEGDYYTTQAQAQENVNTLYRLGAPTFYGNANGAYQGPFASIPVMLTGYFENSYEGQEQINQYSRLLTRQQNTRIVSNRINEIWRTAFQAINIANGAIKNIPNITMPDDVKARLTGEAKFFRAFNYFFMVKMFGGLPLSTDQYASLDQDFFLPRSAPAEVYKVIEEDLIAAVESLPDGIFNSSGRRVNRNVAAIALANVYLQQNKYAEAVPYIDIVLQSGHTLATNTDLAANSAYNKLRTSDLLDETIYAMEFDAVINPGGSWPTYGFTASANAIFDKYTIFERVYGPTNRFLNVYEDDDLRIKPNQYYHWSYTNPLNDRTWNGGTVAGVWAFVEEDALLNTGRSVKDRNIYRYAEALLIAAEVKARATGVATAAGHLAEVRARASTTGETVAEITAQLQGLSVDQFVQEVWKERLRELPLEFKMWDDCLRTGMFPNISATNRGQVTFQPLVGAANGSGATFKQSDLVYPISMDELQRNPNLEQNPEYQTN
ncbi:RagB/SusD family nutrient uptake outer membrane protein [Sphingobacterium corticibacter]|uniref:RagB/SusD family nutrient uptake outer membrane protein n=1 Tax=Sphingobacterium corticibacter TaxID=2171749 RepID=A0A2T8HL77_9SPHI|nr:RagB/SusD family nutrient uptake outer membrane protein [Sphingobacterium corticibacter]PVH26194.1 RagB/SusD family nutrient uptake outer membrane protein [Sphingobacterium corticibacter]